MKLSRMFKQATLGLAITAMIAPAACAHKPVEAPQKSGCRIIESGPAPLHYNISDSFPTLHVYDYDLKTISHIDARKGKRVTAAASATAPERKKYEALKQRLSPACKQKSGIK